MSATDPFDTASHLDLQLMQGFPPPPDKRVTRANGLWVPPYNRWAYQNMRAIWPTAAVRPAAKPIDIPRLIDARIDGINVTRQDGSVADFATFLRQTFTDSFVVITKGQVVYERFLNGMTARQPHIMFSCTKSFVGLFALMAIDEGLVTEDTPIVSILPELANSGFALATFGQVLDMTASIRFNEDYADPKAEVHDYAAVLGAGLKTEGSAGADSIYAFVSALASDDSHPHGAAFVYQTPKTDVLNWAVNRLFGQSYIQLLERRIWSRIGTDGDAHVMVDPAGVIFAGGGLNATAQDLTRFAAMALASGQIAGAQVIAPGVFDTIAKGGSTTAFLQVPNAEGAFGDGYWSYRAQWWVRNTPGHQAFMALGVNGQWIYIDRQHDVAIVKQSSQPEADTPYFNVYTLNAIDAVIAHLAG